MSLSIVDRRLSPPVLLAPMAGITDVAFRALVARFGAGLVVSEMVGSQEMVQAKPGVRARAELGLERADTAVQLAGRDPYWMAEAARMVADNGARLIDINMGCPAKKVCRKAAGSALLRDEVLVREILEAAVAAVDVPVTLKMRTGWSPQVRNGVSIARIAEDAGIAALAVHGRTRADRFLGEAEFETLARIVRAVDIPVLANGDIDSPERAAEVLAETGAAGVMIGRAAQGRPWLCGQIATWLEDGVRLPDPDAATRSRILRCHLERLHAFHGEQRGVRIARKHVGWALADQGGSARAMLRAFNAIESPGEQLDAVTRYFSGDFIEGAVPAGTAPIRDVAA